MNLFYASDIEGLEYTLSVEESKHCLRVLRLSVGNTIHLVDGRGGFYTARIVSTSGNRCKVEVVERISEYGKRSYRLHVAIAPTKNVDRLEWFLEKATEIGVDEVTPIECEHSERRTIKYERLEKVVESAMKQSYKAYHPKLNKMQPFEQLVVAAAEQSKLIAHCAEGEKKLLKDILKQTNEALVLVGPEGDFSPKEVSLARQYGFQEVSLGESRLRTETAGIVVCCAASFAS